MKDLPEKIAPTLRSNMTMRQYYSWLWNGQQTFNVSGIKRKMRRTVCSAFDNATECNQHCTVACHEETDPEKLRFTATLHSLPKTPTDVSFQSYLPHWHCPRKNVKPDVTPIFPWPFLWIAYAVLFGIGAVSVSVLVPVYWCCVGRWRCAVGKAAK